MPLNTIPNKGLTSRGYPSDRLVTPIIINGDMSVAQRATSATSLTSSGYHTVDRYRMGYTDSGTWTQTQESLSSGNAYLNGFRKSIKMDCTTAKSSLAANSELWIEQRIEGQNLQMLKKGTANAEKVTFSFWVKATKTGTYIISIYDNDNTRQCSQSYTVNSSNTWEKKIVTFPADTTGSLDNDNNYSFRIFWFIAMGSNYTSGTLQTTWAAFANANQAVGQVNGADSTDNNFELTGIQMEVGEFDSTTIPSFPFESFENNFRKCCRYFQQIGDGIYTDTSLGGNRLAIGQRDGSGSSGGYPTVPVLSQLRSTPSITYNNLNVRQDGSNKGISSIDTIKNFGMTVSFNLTADSNFSTGETFQIRTTTSNGYMRFDAEL